MGPPRGPECHTASTWDPCEKLNAFCHFFNYFKRFKSKIKSEKSGKKSLKIVKSITFKILIQISFI